MNPKYKGAAKLWLLNLVANAALLACVYFWLLLPDAHGWQVAGSVLLAIVVIFFGLWLRAGSFAYFRLAEFREHAAVWRAFRHALKPILALVLWTIPMAALAWALFSMRAYAPQFGVWFWQKSGVHVANPRQLFHAADWLLWALMFLALVVWLPVASTVAADGLHGHHMMNSLRVLRRPAYWGWFLGLIAIGGYVPCRLVWWIPDLSELSKQAFSMGLRFVLAYVVLISAWVALLLVVGEKVELEDPDPINARDKV